MARNLVTPKGKFAIAEGLPELQKRVADLVNRVDGGNEAGREVKQIWMKGAILIRDQARSNAPTIKSDPKNPKDWQQPGVLKSAIYAAYGRDNAPNVIVGVNYRKAPQAYWIEFGATERTTKSGANRGSVPPNPYFRPAVTQKKAEATAVIAQGYRELIEKAAAA